MQLFILFSTVILRNPLELTRENKPLGPSLKLEFIRVNPCKSVVPLRSLWQKMENLKFEI